MADKTTKKKKAYQAWCREQVKQGFINDAEGKWVRLDVGKAMHRDCKEGYRL